MPDADDPTVEDPADAGVPDAEAPDAGEETDADRDGAVADEDAAPSDEDAGPLDEDAGVVGDGGADGGGGDSGTRPDFGAQPVELRRELGGRWNLDEGTGLLTGDNSGNGNNGVLAPMAMPPRWMTGGFPAAMYFNNAHLVFRAMGDHVELGTTGLPRTNAPLSVALWLNYEERPPSTGAGSTQTAFLLNAVTGANTSGGLHLGVRAGKLGAWKRGGAALVTDPGEAPEPGWHHLAYTFDGTTHVLFVDGLPQARATTAPDNVVVNRARLGANHTGAEGWKGALDDVRLWRRALNEAEVYRLYEGYND
jgi:hypothetical protein